MCQVWRQRGQTCKTWRLLYRSLKARLRYFLLILVTITNELVDIKKVIRLCSDGLVTLAQSREYLVTPSPFNSTLQYSQSFITLSSWLKLNTMLKVMSGAWGEAINVFIILVACKIFFFRGKNHVLSYAELTKGSCLMITIIHNLNFNLG